MSEAAEGPAAPRGPLQRVDDGVFRVERTFVTLAALLMTVTVSLDIVYRSFATKESQLSKKLQTFLGWFGAEKTQSQYETLRDVVTPSLLVLITFVTGWAIFSATRTRREQRTPAGLGAAVGVAGVVACYGFVQFVVKVPSKWVCLTLLLVGSGAYVVYALKQRDVAGVVLTAIVAVLGGMACPHLPAQYIWSQELSLILLAWIAFIGGSMATRAERHITVDALGRLVPKALRPYSRALGLLATAAFCIYMTWLSYEHIFGPGGDFELGERRPATQIPAWTIILSVLVAFVLMSVRFLAKAIDGFINPKVPAQEVNH